MVWAARDVKNTQKLVTVKRSLDPPYRQSSKAAKQWSAPANHARDYFRPLLMLTCHRDDVVTQCWLSSPQANGRTNEWTNQQTRRIAEIRVNKNSDKSGVRPAHTLIPILTKYGIGLCVSSWACFLNFSFRTIGQRNFGVGVEIPLLSLRLMTYRSKLYSVQAMIKIENNFKC